MKKIALFAIPAMFVATSAFGVDLTNKDAQVVHVKVDLGHGIVQEYDHNPGYTYHFICERCTLTVGGASLEVSGRQNVNIQGGKAVAEE